MRAAALLALVLALVPSAAPGVLPVEFLHAEAGERGASGGHVALRVGDHAYHYQRDAEGALVLVRDAWRDFAFRYRALENRSLRAWPLGLPEDAAQALRTHLDARFLAGLLERDRIAALRDDVLLLETLGHPASGPGVAMRGAGFFAAGRGTATDRPAPDLVRALRARIERERGSDFLAAKRREAVAALRDLPPDGATNEGLGEPLSRRYADAWAAVRALDVALRAPSLRRDAVRALPGSTPLAAAERRALAARAEALADSLARLVASPRPDWGFAFLLGAARLAALDASLAGDAFVVLDALPGDVARVPVPGSAADAAGHLAWRREQLGAARALVVARPSDERALATLERAASRHAVLAAALRDGSFPVFEEEALPAGRTRLRDLPRPAFAAGSLETELVRARARLAQARDRRARRHAYDLVTRNCVTELFADVDTALAGSEAALAPPASPLAFIPFAAARGVGGRWTSARPRRLPSLRSDAVERARRDGWLAALGETTAFTSSVYTPHADDSLFLFFTDDAGLARPLLGAANLAAGVVGGVGGALWLPFDGGTALGRGLRGAAASLPELFFGNVRKGTFPLARPVE